LEQWKREKSIVDVPIRAIGTMKERTKPNGCSNKGVKFRNEHTNNLSNSKISKLAMTLLFRQCPLFSRGEQQCK
jgi:hypothetical protein